ncbi:hypothetical protein OS493_031740 [Desmophyllum pertusum]|uniref:Uncharacterized protein n=1 Tax=Desmophyllum pertusum TaxID=174260 RepID=A0A9X0D2Z7_9CNID|nr:hypothetical protein OS493_031740 [Desmophyllum pertusum]
MCKDNSVGLYEQPPAQVAPNGDLNNSLAVSEVAEQLADIGDKVELSYQQRRRRDEEAAGRALELTSYDIISAKVRFRYGELVAFKLAMTKSFICLQPTLQQPDTISEYTSDPRAKDGEV